MFQAACEAIVVLDEDRRQLDANAAACRLLGSARERLVGRRIDELLEDAARERLAAGWPALLRGEAEREGYELRREDGSRVTVEFGPCEELAGASRLWIVRDAAEQRDSAQRLLLELQSVGGFGSWQLDLATDTIEWSAPAREIFGLAAAAGPMPRRTALALVHPDDRASVAGALGSALASGRRFAHEYRALRPDGTFRVIESRGEALLDAGGRPTGLLGTVQDVTDRRQAEIERRNLATVLDTSDDAITTCSLDGVFLTWNRGAEKLYGYTAEEAIGQPLDLIIPPGERATDHVNWERLLNDEPVRSLETVRVTKDGRTVVVSVTRSLIVDASRGVVGVASVGRDITQAKQAQAMLAAAHAEALAASAMKSQFLANMSHEIRTPMNGVIGMNELLLATELTGEQRFYAEQVARSGEDMMRIIDDILDVSKIEAGRLDLDVCDFSLHETIEAACAAAAVEAGAKGVAFELQIDRGVPRRARGDDRRLRQVLRNLVANAVKFTSEGTITVRAGVRQGPQGGARIRLEVADTGIGIDAEALERMFQPFTQADASTTRRYGGTGLGLAIARDLLALMGGALGADSTLGEGSTFWLELDLALPEADGPLATSLAERAQPAGRGSPSQ